MSSEQKIHLVLHFCSEMPHSLSNVSKHVEIMALCRLLLILKEVIFDLLPMFQALVPLW